MTSALTDDILGTGDPQLADCMERLIENLAAGDHAAIECILGENPADADRLRRLLPTLQVLAGLKADAGPSSATNENMRREQHPDWLDEEEQAQRELRGSETRSTHCRLGDFQIIREVGHGGMGIVYEAEQISLRRRVALKVLPFAAAFDPRQLQRFKNEALAAASLHHEHIIPVFSVGCERSVHFYAMQFVEGSTLADVITKLRHDEVQAESTDTNPTCERVEETPKTKGRERQTGNPEEVRTEGSEGRKEEERASQPSLPLLPSVQSAHRAAQTRAIEALSTERTWNRQSFYRRIAELIACAASALEHAHSVGIVHRDIKPGNLMLDLSGKILIGDFGLARFGADAGLTITGDMLGTLRYMAPEQALAKHGLVDTRADIYSLGCTLYELLTLRPTIAATERAEILRQIAFEEPIEPRRHDKRIPFELETITLKCLAKSPADRYPTASDIAAELRRFLDNKPIKARPSTLLQRSRKWSQRHQTLVLTALVTLLLGTAVSAWQAFRATAAEAQAKAHEAIARGEEQKATVLAQSEARQRKLAEKNLQTALDAVDRMLTNVVDPELNDVPRVGPLRRKILKNTIDFYNRVELSTDSSADIHYRVAQTWHRIALESGDLREPILAVNAYSTAIVLLSRLVNHPSSQMKYRSELASVQHDAGWFYKTRLRDAEAEKAFRAAVGLYAALASDESEDKSQRQVQQANSLSGLSAVLVRSGKSEESLACTIEALALLEDSEVASPADHAVVLHQLALRRTMTAPDDADDLRRRAVDEYRRFVTGDPANASARYGFGRLLNWTVRDFANPRPGEIEALSDESIAIWRSMNGPQLPTNRQTEVEFITALLGKARHLRRAPKFQAADDDSQETQRRQIEAKALFQEAIRVERRTISRFRQNDDRFALAQLLYEESQYLLDSPDFPENSAHKSNTAKLEADALLSEAIQLCRALVIDVPDRPEYQRRLAAFLEVQAMHFGQKHDPQAEPSATH